MLQKEIMSVSSLIAWLEPDCRGSKARVCVASQRSYNVQMAGDKLSVAGLRVQVAGRRL